MKTRYKFTECGDRPNAWGASATALTAGTHAAGRSGVRRVGRSVLYQPDARGRTASSAEKPGCSRSRTKLRSRHSTFASFAPMLTTHSVVAQGTTVAEYTTPGQRRNGLSTQTFVLCASFISNGGDREETISHTCALNGEQEPPLRSMLTSSLPAALAATMKRPTAPASRTETASTYAASWHVSQHVAMQRRMFCQYCSKSRHAG